MWKPAIHELSTSMVCPIARNEGRENNFRFNFRFSIRVRVIYIARMYFQWLNVFVSRKRVTSRNSNWVFPFSFPSINNNKFSGVVYEVCRIVPGTPYVI